MSYRYPKFTISGTSVSTNKKEKKVADSASNSGCGCSMFFGLLFLLFLGLKLGEVGVVATWPYWIVTAPLWGYAAAVIVFFAIAFVLAVMVAAINNK